MRPMVAIVIDDMGLHEARSQKVLELPGPLTLSFLTYANDLTTWAARARAAGHEVLAHIPMEPLDAAHNSGPGTLRVAMNAAEVRAQVAAHLDGWSGYVGVNNHMGSRFCQNRTLMDAVMAELKSRALLWLDSMTTAASEGIAAAEAARVPYLVRDVFLDNVDNVDAVLAQLERLEAIGRKRGAAIAIGHPRDATIQALDRWLSSLDTRRLVLVPITALQAAQSLANR
jgi:polysaccharide deacetylase 2 family uncharacterized protein YibQ